MTQELLILARLSYTVQFIETNDILKINMINNNMIGWTYENRIYNQNALVNTLGLLVSPSSPLHHDAREPFQYNIVLFLSVNIHWWINIGRGHGKCNRWWFLSIFLENEPGTAFPWQNSLSLRNFSFLHIYDNLKAVATICNYSK